ncbi:MAG: thioredoxin domain-containing protein [Chitinophagaceae bacterium]|nr:thioredoxin domain-containing protein [Anaerolineae bacterium]
MTKNKSEKTPIAAKATGTNKTVGPSRSRTRERRMEKQQQKRRQQQISLLIGGVVFAIVAVVLFIVANQPASAPIPAGVETRYVGIPQDVTENGFPRLGKPDAPVQVEEFSSFSCSGCAEFHSSYFDDMIDLVREGKISFTFIPITTTGSIANAEGSAKAALCASEQGKFFEYQDTLFDWQTRYGNQAFTQNRLTSGVENIGLNQGTYDSCIGSSRINNILDTAQQLFTERGVSGTPAVFVNGNSVSATASDVIAAVDQAIVSGGLVAVPLEAASTPEAESTPAATSESTPEVTETMTEEAESDVEATAEATSDGS